MESPRAHFGELMASPRIISSDLRSRLPSLFALVAICLPCTLGILFAPNVQAVLATVAINLVVLSLAMRLYCYRLIRLALHLFLLLVPISVFYRTLYRGAISPGVLLSIMSTTPDEARELLGTHLWITACLAAYVLIALYFVVASWRARGCYVRATLIRVAVLSIGAIGLWIAVTCYQLGEQRRNLIYALKDTAREVFPLDIILSTKITATGKLVTILEASAHAAFEFKNVRVADATVDADPQTLVIVVGEASRRKSWSLYGYGRPTTPELEKLRRELIVFDSVTSNANITIYSLSLALTRASPTTWDVAGREKSIISLLRQGGYFVDWISNQERYGGAENRISTMALESNSVSFANDYSADPLTEKDPFDSNLLPRLANVLKSESSRKTVIFLHMMGSHDRYRERYPAAFEIFSGPYGSRELSSRQLRILNEYDNSIRFTDFVLASIIRQVSALGQRSAVLYFSDHGERVFEPEDPDLMGHGFPTPSIQEIEVPLVIWLSASYRLAHPELIHNLEANAHSSAQLQNVFETIVDLAGLSHDGQKAEPSLFSPSFKSPTVLEILSTLQTAICVPSSDIKASHDQYIKTGSVSVLNFRSCAEPAPSPLRPIPGTDR
jgi:heptose-I-phosphate ethanolaminephosphotransferase